MIAAMEQLHSLSALDDEGLLTRLGRRVNELFIDWMNIFILLIIDGRVSIGASVIKDVNSISTFRLQ